MRFWRSMFISFLYFKIGRKRNSPRLWGTLNLMYRNRLMLTSSMCPPFLKIYCENKDSDVVDDEMDDISEWFEECLCEEKFSLMENELIDCCSSLNEMEHFLINTKYSLVLKCDSLLVFQKYSHQRKTMIYKVIGRFNEISAKSFFDVQCDITYRRIWDTNALLLNCIDERNGCDLIHWVCSYPSPLECREYLFVRRNWTQYLSNSKLALCYKAKGLPDKYWESLQDQLKYDEKVRRVQVHDYEMEMIVVPDECHLKQGFTYIMSYVDNSKTYIPFFVQKYILKYGLIGFLNQMNKASKLYIPYKQPKS